jgi:hypothetical protein
LPGGERAISLAAGVSMKSRQIIAWLALAASAAPASAADKPVVVLEPSSEWVLDYAEERCSFYRDFGQGDDALTLRIDSFGPGVDYRMVVVGPAIPEFGRPTDDMTIRFTPDEEERETMGLNGKVGDLPAIGFTIAITPYESPDVYERMSSEERKADQRTPRLPVPEFEQRIESIEMKFRDRSRIRLALGRMGKPLAAMRQCMDNLQQAWGLDPAVQGSLSRIAVPKPSTVQRVQRRYPHNMLLTGTNAYVPVRVMVSAEGRATACVVQIPEIDRAFKDSVCDGLESSYEPALDQQGRAVASVYRVSVFYLTG